MAGKRWVTVAGSSNTNCPCSADYNMLYRHGHSQASIGRGRRRLDNYGNRGSSGLTYQGRTCLVEGLVHDRGIRLETRARRGWPVQYSRFNVLRVSKKNGPVCQEVRIC